MPHIQFNFDDNGDWEAIIDNPEHLIFVLKKVNEKTRVVTDIGVSFIGGWGDIRRVRYYAGLDTLELFFD